MPDRYSGTKTRDRVAIEFFRPCMVRFKVQLSCPLYSSLGSYLSLSLPESLAPHRTHPYYIYAMA